MIFQHLQVIQPAVIDRYQVVYTEGWVRTKNSLVIDRAILVKPAKTVRDFLDENHSEHYLRSINRAEDDITIFECMRVCTIWRTILWDMVVLEDERAKKLGWRWKRDADLKRCLRWLGRPKRQSEGPIVGPFSRFVVVDEDSDEEL